MTSDCLTAKEKKEKYTTADLRTQKAFLCGANNLTLLKVITVFPSAMTDTYTSDSKYQDNGKLCLAPYLVRVENNRGVKCILERLSYKWL